uniref:Ribosomal protein S6 kinase polypeptide 1 n=1 Tax=Cyprinus carpio carpio TaxID=630221 RepID=A0A9J8DMT8_CYPCA
MISARNKDDIVRFYTVTDPMTHKKGYTVYKVTARIISRKNPEDIQEITVWKRYSDFKKLHQNLWQIHRNLYGQSELFPPFAKAKVFGRFDESVIEKRRQFSANIPALYGSQYILDLFKGGEVQDSSELIGPAEPFTDFLADSLLDRSSEGEESPSRREAVKRKTAEYLMRAELISGQLTDSMGQSSTQTRALGSQCCGGLWAEQTHSDELKHYRVLGIIDKVLLVMDRKTQETFILKGLRKSSACGHVKKTIVPHSVPNMVQLEKYIISEDSIFLLLQYAEGGKLWSHICKYLHDSSPDESFNIPFIQKAHSAAVHSTMNPMHTDSSSVDSRGLSLGENPLAAQMPDSGATSEEECTNSYLTLWNEYEQERLEPDEDCCSLAPVLTQKHTCSVLNTDRLCPPDIDAGAVLLH